MNIIDNIEQSEAHSVTAAVCENAALYGAAPERDEFDTRDVWDGDDAIDAVHESFRILSQGVGPDGFQLADERESLLWGYVNMLDAQTRRLDRAADKLTARPPRPAARPGRHRDQVARAGAGHRPRAEPHRAAATRSRSDARRRPPRPTGPRPAACGGPGAAATSR